MFRLIFGAFLVWLIMRDRLGVYRDLMIAAPDPGAPKADGSKPDGAIGWDWLYLFRKQSAPAPSTTTKKPDTVNL